MEDIAERAMMAGIPVVTRQNGERMIRVNESTWDYLTKPAETILIGPLCRCRSFREPHEVERHRVLRSDFDWRTWQEREAWKQLFR